MSGAAFIGVMAILAALFAVLVAWLAVRWADALMDVPPQPRPDERWRAYWLATDKDARR